MYLDYFNLEKEPFSMTPDPSFLHLTPQHQDVLESILYAIEARKGFITLTGEIGTGKTTLSRELVNRLDRQQVEVAVILNPLLSINALLRTINKDFGNKFKVQSDEEELDRLHKFLLQQAKRGKNAVVLIDEAQTLSIEALEMIRLISNLETDEKKLLQIILVGQPELEETLLDHRLRQLAQRITVRFHLTRLTPVETKDYIFHRLVVAGGSGHAEIHFRNNSLNQIYSFSEGYPRLINAVCDRTLLAAFAHRTHTVTKPLVREAIRDIRGYFKKVWWKRCLSFWTR